MNGTVRLRRLIALFAAYVVALQALLLPLTVAAGASFDTNLCAASGSANGAQPPASHDNGCPCAAGCGIHCLTQAYTVPPQAVSPVAAAPVMARLAPPLVERSPAPAHFGSPRARAPPFA